MFTLHPWNWSTVWTAVAAIGQLIAFAWALIMARSYFVELKSRYCDELGAEYAMLLSHALDKPFLLDPTLRTTSIQKQQYEVYAYMMWNFIETVIDRVGNDKKLLATWMPVFTCECTRHAEWFGDNKDKFKDTFCDRIAAQIAAQAGKQPSFTPKSWMQAMR